MADALRPRRHAEITLAWADGEHAFRLGLGQLRELQEKTDAGPAFLLDRLSRGTWRVDDIRETIRLGLIGGGKAPAEALALVTRYVDERPLMESIPVAQAIIMVAIMPVEDDPLGKPAPAGDASGLPNAGSSPSPASTAPGLQ